MHGQGDGGTLGLGSNRAAGWLQSQEHAQGTHSLD